MPILIWQIDVILILQISTYFRLEKFFDIGDVVIMNKIKIDPEVYFGCRMLDSFEKSFPLLFEDTRFKEIYFSLIYYLESKYPKELLDFDIEDVETFFIVK